MDSKEERKILIQAIRHYGIEHQTDKAIEECAELINTLIKFRDKRVETKEIITEIADVQIMLNQLILMYSETLDDVPNEIERKLNRLWNRLIRE